MTKADFDYKLECLSLCAGMNQRVHQERAGFWARRDRNCKIAVGFLSVLGLCLSVVTVFNTDPYLVGLSLFVALLASVVAVALNVIPLGEWASDHKALFQRWTDFRGDVEALAFDIDGEPSRDLVDRLKDLDAKVHRICGSEPAPDDELIARCYEAEKACRKEEEPAAACAS